MRIKRDKADHVFSEYIRLRDSRCVNCGIRGMPRKDGLPINNLECSHFFGRRKESVRFDEDNAEALCFTCHKYLGEHPHEHHSAKLDRLGQEKYDALVLRANRLKKGSAIKI